MTGDQYVLGFDRRARLPVRELVLASAGFGKTHQLTSRLIELLASGVPAQEILASTFTRKAAGEISDRLLLRLADAALETTGASALPAGLDPGGPAGALETSDWADLLLRLSRRLNRLQVYTLDAFFHRIAASFALEIGLPLRWRVATDVEREQLLSEAVDAAIEETDPSILVELVRQVGYGRTDRGVHALLLRAARDLHETYVNLDPTVSDPWGFEGGVSRFVLPDPENLASRISEFERTPMPTSKNGSPDSRWVAAREAAATAAREGDWGAFLQRGFTRAIADGKDSFGRKPISEDVRAATVPLLDAARNVLGGRYQRRVEALGRFMPSFDAHLRVLERERGLYGFPDLTHAVMRASESTSSDEIFYRLDARIRHLLLDEFQDTSNVQWSALEPLAGEILSGHREERAVFVVADPKQSIFGWRGGEPRLLGHLERAYGLERRTLSGSRRSSSVVLDTVNRVFGVLDGLEALADLKDEASAWAVAFEPHAPVEDRPGYVRLEVGPSELDETQRLPQTHLDFVARSALDLHRSAPGAEIGILTRTNASAGYLIASLKQLGAEASEEGGVPVTDSAPVLGLLALLRMADSPGDSASAYVVSRTSVGRVVGVGPDGWRRPEVVAARARALRATLLSSGYGPTVSTWARAISEGLPARDRRRLRQLSELAHAWDERGTLRPRDFVRFAESSRAEDPAQAAIRVMTIHRSKGLEFDAVFLPDLETSKLEDDSRYGFLPYREYGAGPVRRVYPGVRGAERGLFPELSEAEAQVREIGVRDGLSLIYVALTRARNAVYVSVRPDGQGGGGSRRRRMADDLLCEALAPGRERTPSSVLYEEGDPTWWSTPTVAGRLAARRRPARPGPRRARGLALAPSPGRRGLERDTPSRLASSGGVFSLGDELAPAAKERGVLVHRWLESVEWLDDGEPDEAVLRSIALDVGARHTDLDELIEAFHRWLRAPSIRELLTSSSYPRPATVEREVPFLVRDGRGMLEGRIDRLVTAPGRVQVVDWKTDSVDPEGPGLESRVERYRPQLDAYRRAAASLSGADIAAVEGCLVFVGAGVVRSWSGRA